ncbi:N-methylhydantoinase (ATP-hydrolyzing) [Dehalobacter sp. UNSWDHB]|jgi:N-methylhydantoinase A/oxoprolinase/acetone carboxylase beta subunit|uniref:hydantoinase/oxoprolinase family protein n=1 Tax=unclassified Dehalobacter TaxID=2635733 RepID=UPI00028ACD26|nr:MULTISPECIES: hydantoinase/oxoprolinase family protein [unclassified Dehalobacter]AFV01631.1 N-methylhydantoinase (ATP-hydrolyzing) [Dehalobacter sp. DCA]AFV04667.1 N-methylhydantoinase (ATP-hydrolyzing) [Dehalobacter sp. CF]EQB21953.1 N-methylhydantoinase (ATP-hydrolyzing) [Dehalobacter sp. UNSWDHB]
MASLIGIDVGGTFTDAVMITNGVIERKGKIPTNQDDILNTIISALDYLQISKAKNIETITVSTTLVTNAIMQKDLPEVELILFPGTGMKLSSLPWPVDYSVLTGVLDYRGRVVVPADQSEWQTLAEKLNKQSVKPLTAIVSKFSHRNNVFEEQLAAYLHREVPGITTALGSQSGQANFYRRSLTTYLNLAATELFQNFAYQLKMAVEARGCRAPIRVLKADGGVLPLAKIRPVESIYSGPAASVLGTLAQSNPEESYVVVDIGGTTTDIGLVLSGSPLISTHGAQIGPFLTNVRSLAVRSVSIGGDSAVCLDQGEVMLAEYRLGPAYCIGGISPTPTDALRYLNLTDYGDLQRAEEALGMLLPENQRTASDLRRTAEIIVEKMVEKIARAIEQLLEEWKTEPAYKVWEVIHHHDDFKFYIQLSGGGAPGLEAALEDRMKLRTVLTEFSEVSNAIGAAMAKPTFSWTLHLDTKFSIYRIEETGEQGIWTGPKKPHREVEDFLKELAQKQAVGLGIETDDLEKEIFDYFPLVENYHTVGQIVKGAMHVPPGVIGRIRS